LNQLHLSLSQSWLIDNRLPSPTEIMKEYQQNPQVSPLLKEEVVILTGATRGDQIWAYTQYPQQAGEHFVVTNQGISDKPNWLTDPRAETPANQLPVENNTGKPGLGVTLPKPDDNATLPPAPKPQGGNTTGVLQPQSVAPPVSPSVTKAGNPVTEADMKEVWVFMENASIVSGKLPPMPLVYAALVKAEAKAAELVKDGSITLTNATTRESIWAFETRALTKGGWVASQNGVENLTAVELKKRLGR
jgi:hypothetical protein